MRIEEKCRCGACLILQIEAEPNYHSDRQDAAARGVEAWKQVDRWRKMHAGCRGPRVGVFVGERDRAPFVLDTGESRIASSVWPDGTHPKLEIDEPGYFGPDDERRKGPS